MKEKPKCLCKTTMRIVVGGRFNHIWECPKCFRLLVQRDYSGFQSWYKPEGG